MSSPDKHWGRIRTSSVLYRAIASSSVRSLAPSGSAACIISQTESGTTHPFDELKNQWGWGGFVTRDLARTRFVARFVALLYNLWSIFTRLVSPQAHREAKTSRPALLNVIGRITRSGRTTVLHLVSNHALADRIAGALDSIHNYLRTLRATAGQLGPGACGRPFSEPHSAISWAERRRIRHRWSGTSGCCRCQRHHLDARCPASWRLGRSAMPCGLGANCSF